MRRRSSGVLRFQAWLAMCALLVQALLPSVMHAASPGSRAFAEICTASGIRAVVDPAETPPKVFSQKHCPFCQLGDLHAVLQDPVGMVPFSSPVFHISRLPASQEYQAARLFAYLRGPPDFS